MRNWRSRPGFRLRRFAADAVTDGKRTCARASRAVGTLSRYTYEAKNAAHNAAHNPLSRTGVREGVQKWHKYMILLRAQGVHFDVQAERTYIPCVFRHGNVQWTCGDGRKEKSRTPKNSSKRERELNVAALKKYHRLLPWRNHHA